MKTWAKLGDRRMPFPGDWRARPSGPYVRFTKEKVEHSIGGLFEAQTDGHPHHLAVKAAGREVTYSALNDAANGVGYTIVAARGNQRFPVALLIEADIPLITAMLGALKAGRACVVVDPSYPPKRIAFILDDSQADLILTDGRNIELARRLARNGCRVLNVDRLDQNLSVGNLEITVSPEAPAYLLYTSGSTGTPRGVIQNHRVVLHNVMKYTNAFHICEDDRLTMLFPYSFGEAMNNIYSALLNGASILPWPPTREPLSYLADWLNRERITIYHSVSTFFRHFVASLKGAERFPALRVINLSGEPVYRQDMELYRRHFLPPCVLVNSLGSTETKLICQYFADHETRITGNFVPAGYASEDVKVQVLDENGREVQPGRVGEIVVTSKYLSQGYWRQEELTERAFAPSPGHGGERIYRTGDLGRMNPDGLVEHLGRKDSLVKPRGFRIELGEIEAVLVEHPAVREAVVLAREDQPGKRRLVAYVVPTRDGGPTISELRDFVTETLPAYMVPSTFLLYERLPITPSGKVDRGALPAPARGRPELHEAFVAPRTPVEEVLADIWSEVLGISSIGVRDNFLYLGGDSLLAIQMATRLSATFQAELSPRTFFETPTVAELSQVIMANEAKPGQTEKVARIMSKIKSMSAEDVQRTLEEKKGQRTGERS